MNVVVPERFGAIAGERRQGAVEIRKDYCAGEYAADNKVNRGRHDNTAGHSGLRFMKMRGKGRPAQTGKRKFLGELTRHGVERGENNAAAEIRIR